MPPTSVMPLLIGLALGCGPGAGPAGTSADPGEAAAPAPPELPFHDSDGDGWTIKAGDCDDTDPSVHPGAEEPPCDAIDRDCDGAANTEPARLQRAGSDGTPMRFPSIQTALDAAESGDTVYVCPGVHDEQLVVSGLDWIGLVGWSGEPSDTVVQPQAGGMALLADEVGQIVVRDLGFSNPAGEGGEAGCMGVRLGFAELDGVVFEDCNGLVGGGLAVGAPLGLDPEGPPVLRVQDSEFRDNESTYGAALFVAQGSAEEPFEPARVEVLNSVFTGNTGGAVYVGGAMDIRFEGCNFSDNRAESDPGAILFETWAAEVGPSRVAVVDSWFEGNHTGSDGGALKFANAREGVALHLDIEGSTFLGNTAQSTGGALDFDVDDGADQQSLLRIVDSVFEDNQALAGAGIYLEYNHGAPGARGEFRIEDTQFVGNNRATDALAEDPWGAGAIHLPGHDVRAGAWDLVWEGLLFEENRWGFQLVLDDQSTLEATDVEVVGTLDGTDCCQGYAGLVRGASSTWTDARFYGNRTPQVLGLLAAHGDGATPEYAHSLTEVDFGTGDLANPGEDIVNCMPSNQGLVDAAVLTQAQPCP